MGTCDDATNASGGSATSASSHNIKTGDIVWVSFIGGDSRQRLVIGSTGAVANPVQKNQRKHTVLCRDISPKIKEQVTHLILHLTVTADQPEKNKNLGVKPIGAMGDEDESRQIDSLKQPYSLSGNQYGDFTVTVADGKCASNPATKMDSILAEFFGAVQSTNGNIGSYYVSKYTGELFDIQTIAKGYISRIQNIVGEL